MPMLDERGKETHLLYTVAEYNPTAEHVWKHL